MDPTVNEWLSLVLRWLHVITGIAWIGSSFYFMWLDARLIAPTRPRPQVESEIWLVHSGGFYLTERRSLKPGEMPRELHWFKWEAAFTWISGFALLTVVYYLGAGVVLRGRTGRSAIPAGVSRSASPPWCSAG